MLGKCSMMAGGSISEAKSGDAAQQPRNPSAKKFSRFQNLWQWRKSNIPCTTLIQEGKTHFWWANLVMVTCFYLHPCPCRVSPKENHGWGLFWCFINEGLLLLLLLLLQRLCLALGRGDTQITAYSKWVCAGNAHCWSFVHSTFPINCQISLWQLNTCFRHILKIRHARPSSDFISLNHLLCWAVGRRQQPQIHIKLLSGRITGQGLGWRNVPMI